MRISAVVRFEIGEIVYLITDDDQLKRMVIAYTIDANNAVSYTLCAGAFESAHYAVEISRDKTII